MNTHCIWQTKRENIKEYIEKNKGLVVIYGATSWGEGCRKSHNFMVDYFCDQKASILHSYNGIPVININMLREKIEESCKRATIIICVKTRKTLYNIYNNLMQLDLNADVFDYFENEEIFSDSTFSLDGKTYCLFEHSYNCGYIHTRMTERSVELALAKEYVNDCNEKIVEIGAVTPYYFYDDKISSIFDITDTHMRVTKKSIFECDLNGKNVLTISTVEHIGTSDYGIHETKNAIDAITKIMEEAASYLITAPLGYNNLLDEWVRKNQNSSLVKVLQRTNNNNWGDITGHYTTIEYTELWANGLVIIEKKNN